MRVLKFLLKSSTPYRQFLIGIMMAMSLVAIDNTVKPFLVKHFIDTIAGTSHDSLVLLCFIYGGLQVMVVSAWTFMDFCLVNYMAPMRCNIADYFINRLNAYSYAFFQGQLVGNLTSKLGDAFNLTPGLIFIIINECWYALLLILISLGFLFHLHPLFGAIMSAWVVLFFGITFFSMKKVVVLTKIYAEEKSKLLGLIADFLGNIFSVKIFATKEDELSECSKLKKLFLKIARRYGFYLTRFYFIQGFFSSIYALSFIIALIKGYHAGWIRAGDFAFVIMTSFNVINTLYPLSHKLRDFVIDWGTVDQALLLLEKEPEIKDQADAKNLIVLEGRIVFDRVKFSYENVEPLFENKSLVMEPGQRIGLVGSSGGGKTTFAHLILRLYDVSSGSILIDGQDVRSVTQDSLRRAIGFIPQDLSLFHRSLMENIRYSRHDATDEEVVEAARQAQLHEMIMQLPEGYQSLVGERGIKLSGGQRQRIAIARAILKQAPILIFDEATSQLDSITEELIQKNLWHLMSGKTTIVIAHRLSTLLAMDRILVFERGSIVEDGTHEQLLACKGFYKKLWDAQVGGFLTEQ